MGHGSFLITLQCSHGTPTPTEVDNTSESSNKWKKLACIESSIHIHGTHPARTCAINLPYNHCSRIYHCIITIIYTIYRAN